VCQEGGAVSDDGIAGTFTVAFLHKN
jgi:hypothetical protein